RLRQFAVRSLLSVAGFLPYSVLAEEVQAPRVEYQATSGGVHVFVPGKWGVLNLEVINPLHEPQELLSTTYFEGQPTLQFGRRIWVPARSQLQTWQAVLAPEDSAQASDRLDFHSLVLKETSDTDVAAHDDTGRILHSGFLPVHRDMSVVGILENPSDGVD